MKDTIISLIEKSGIYSEGGSHDYYLVRLPGSFNDMLNRPVVKEKIYDILGELDESLSEDGRGIIPANLDESLLEDGKGFIPANLLVTKTKFDKSLKCVHVSHVENYDSIVKNGLKIPQNNRVPNLGKGVYCVRSEYDIYDEFGEIGFENFSNWVLEYNGVYLWDEDSDYEEILTNTRICVVEFEYTGLYDECIFGDNHHGFIVIRKDIKPEFIKAEIMLLKDFVSKYSGYDY